MIRNLTAPTMSFQQMDINPCRTIEKGANGEKDIVEQCEESEAEFYSIYVHLRRGEIQCIADCDNLKEAQEFVEFLKEFSLRQGGNSFFTIP